MDGKKFGSFTIDSRISTVHVMKQAVIGISIFMIMNKFVRGTFTGEMEPGHEMEAAGPKLFREVGPTPRGGFVGDESVAKPGGVLSSIDTDSRRGP